MMSWEQFTNDLKFMEDSEMRNIFAPIYCLSKAAQNAYTRILDARLKKDKIDCVTINSVDPGWAKTDMGGSSAPLSIEQGADTVSWLAALKEKGDSGAFFCKRNHVRW